MHPPGLLATTETAAGHDRQEGDTAPSKREAIRIIRARYCWTGAQANHWYREQVDRFKREEGREPVEDAAWFDRLMRLAPGPPRNRPVTKLGVPKHMRSEAA